MANLNVDFFGATDAQQIKGFESRYKRTTDPSFTNVPFYPTTSGGGSFTIPSLVYGATYLIETRTVNFYDLVSSWKQTFFDFNLTYSGLRTNGVVDVADKCLGTPSVIFYSVVPLANLDIGNYIYGNEECTLKIIGGNKYYKTNNNFIVYRIDNDGQIIDIDSTSCLPPVTITNYFPSIVGVTNRSYRIGEVCYLELSNSSLYIFSYNTVPTIGDVFKSGPSTNFNGGNNWWLISNDSMDAFYEVRINTVGDIIAVNICN